jgi:SulP family sulfate permease
MSEHTAGSAAASGPLGYLREAAGGVSATFILLTQMLTLGLIAYGPLGTVAVEAGVNAAFAASIFGILTALVLGGALLPNEIPRASTVLVFAAFVARLTGDPALRGLPGGGVDEILFLSALCLAFGGIIQVAFGVLRLGSIARFVPYPVVAGLMTGLAISLVFYELPHILGVHGDGGHGEAAVHAAAPAHGDGGHGEAAVHAAAPAHGDGGHGEGAVHAAAPAHGDAVLQAGSAEARVAEAKPPAAGGHAEAAAKGEDAAHAPGAAHGGWQPWTLLVALVTIATVFVVGRIWPGAPSKLIGVAAGTAVAAVTSYFWHGIDLGPRVPELAASLPVPDALFPLGAASGLKLASHYFYEIIVAAAAIAVIGSLDSLLAAVGEMEGPLDTGHQPNRLLIALGFGNIMSALFGGVPLAYSSHHALVKAHDERRNILPALATAGTLVLLLLYGRPLLQLIPLAVLAGVMTVIAFSLINGWAGAIVQRARRRQYDRELTLNVVLVLLVAAITIVFGLVPAVVTGLILSMALFIAMMNRSLVRSVSTGETRASRRVYPPEQAKLLREHGKEIKVIDIDGAIFFGTSDRLGAEAQRAAEGARFVILDLHRVTMIDASGALMLERLAKGLREQGTQLLLAHISPTSPLGRAVQAAGAFTEKHRPDWFADGDRALEWAERQLLAGAKVSSEAGREIRIGDFELLAGLAQAELDFMKPYLDRQLLPPRTPLFHAGQQGDRLYLLARGAVSVVAEDAAAGKYRRIVTLAPGVIFGESAMVDDEVHSVTAIAEEEIVLWSLSRRNLEAIRAANPALYQRLLVNLLAHLARMLRMTAGILREESEALQ